jgi:hypothetical protein
LTGKGGASHPVYGLSEATISAPGIPSSSTERIRFFASSMRIHGEKYRNITIFRNGTTRPEQEAVEVSSNLVDWFSGPKHTAQL